MNSRFTSAAATGGIFGCTGALLLVFFAGAIVGAFCWPYTINTWLVFAHKDPVIVWWQGFLLGFIPGLGQLALPLTAITWIAMHFLK